MDVKEAALALHRGHRGKISVESKVPLRTRADLSLAYTPGVAEPCRIIASRPEEVYTYTARGNLVAIVTDGSAVLGLGDIGPEAALPVMEGKAVLFKTFAGVDAFPLCLATKDVDAIVETVKLVAPTFGGINLEDISAPRCFAIEERLKAELNIPVFHDDQHGTAIVVLAALLNALRLVGKSLEEVTVTVNGAGAAGIAIARLLVRVGVADVIVCDRAGAIYPGRAENNAVKEEIAAITNKGRVRGDLAAALEGRDVFIGASAPGVVTGDMVRRMAARPVVFALANPVPEIWPDEAKAAGAVVVGTGRSDFPNQVNNVLAFPGVFRGALDARARQITEEMKLAAAKALADLVGDALSPDYCLPDPFDERVVPAVAAAVRAAAGRA
jgi:malate dehydrogenase (oxaloacetate-decarboxylating)